MVWSAKCRWDEKMIDTLKQMWTAGIPAREIGEALNTTKNSVIGKAHREHLLARTHEPVGRPSKPVTKHKTSPPRRKAPPFIPNATPLPQIWTGGPVLMTEATSGQCRAIISSSGLRNGEAVVCGAPVPAASRFSFCAQHLSVFTYRRAR